MKDVLTAFFEAYGLGITMLGVGGLVVAFMIELSVKNGFNWIEGKVSDEKVKAVIPIIRFFSIIVVSVMLTVRVTEGIVDQWSLPSGGFVMFIWWSICYICQFVFSVCGIKGLIYLMEVCKAKGELRAAARAELKAMAEANKPKLTPVAGTKGLYVTDDGQYVNAKGQPV